MSRIFNGTSFFTRDAKRTKKDIKEEIAKLQKELDLGYQTGLDDWDAKEIKKEIAQLRKMLPSADASLAVVTAEKVEAQRKLISSIEREFAMASRAGMRTRCEELEPYLKAEKAKLRTMSNPADPEARRLLDADLQYWSVKVSFEAKQESNGRFYPSQRKYQIKALREEEAKRLGIEETEKSFKMLKQPIRYIEASAAPMKP